jgi:hypothetical protein
MPLQGMYSTLSQSILLTSGTCNIFGIANASHSIIDKWVMRNALSVHTCLLGALT